VVCFNPWMGDWIEAMIVADLLLFGYAEPPITFERACTP